MLKVNKIFTDPIQMSKAVEARRERNKRCDDVENGCYCPFQYEEHKNCPTRIEGEYSKQKLARERYKKRVNLCLWLVVGIIIIIGLLN